MPGLLSRKSVIYLTQDDHVDNIIRDIIREFTKPRWRRRGQRQLNNEFIKVGFHLNLSEILRSLKKG